MRDWRTAIMPFTKLFKKKEKTPAKQTPHAITPLLTTQLHAIEEMTAKAKRCLLSLWDEFFAEIAAKKMPSRPYKEHFDYTALKKYIYENADYLPLSALDVNGFMMQAYLDLRRAYPQYYIDRFAKLATVGEKIYDKHHQFLTDLTDILISLNAHKQTLLTIKVQEVVKIDRLESRRIQHIKTTIGEIRLEVNQLEDKIDHLKNNTHNKQNQLTPS